VLIIAEQPYGKDDIQIHSVLEYKHQLLTQVIGRIRILDNKFHFKQIIIDETGLGAGPTDMLKETCGGRVKGLTFTIKSKEEIYGNLLRLLELRKQGKPGGLHLPQHKKLLFQLLDLRYEITSSGEMKIHHSEKGHDDFPDALALACSYWNPKKMLGRGGFILK
jgi:hypothetical protein